MIQHLNHSIRFAYGAELERVASLCSILEREIHDAANYLRADGDCDEDLSCLADSAAAIERHIKSVQWRLRELAKAQSRLEATE